ncbi:alpha/beta fold hydrolase [Pseudodesulfovibrio cashew]|uniref:Alpha/beta fold hydrolase n=1 Tax=Pseudodesulfovibrio cashew TaxID=2678688 RepID=A0A6I6JNS8_9BACT|nr:alpha/beta hydrolase [Pseudodesulfovibrio cashew]QGY41797.1 alpha/beta fold hydrolase [Pseudodesulfovibrio cashew]
MSKFDHENGQTVAVKGADIYYETKGTPDGEPLLLLHGGLGTMTDLNVFADELPACFLLISIDFRGHGKSTMGAAPLTYAQHQEDVEAVLAHLGVAETSIFGFSDGGIVGYRMAAQSPVRVRRLVTLGSHWRLQPDDPALPLLSGLTPEKWKSIFPDSVESYEKTNPQPDFDALVKAVVALWTDLTPTGYPNESIRSIQAPVLIARGDNDHLFSLEEAVELHGRIEGSGLLNIPYAGHAAYEDSPKVFINAVNAFLEKDLPTQ